MIPVGGFDPERIADAAALARRDASATDVEELLRGAEAALDRLVAQWRADRSSGDASCVSDGTVRETVEAVNAVLEAVDQIHHGPRLIRPRNYP